MIDITIVLLITTTLLGVLFFGLFVWGYLMVNLKILKKLYVIFRDSEK